MDNQLILENTLDSAGGVEEMIIKDKAVSMEPITWRDFVQLTKPGIIFSNLITAFGGFWVAAKWNIDWALLFFMIIGTILVIGSGGVLNNYLDRDMDTKMKRTQKRVLPMGKMEPNFVFWYGIVMGIVGLSVLWFLVTPLSALVGLLGLFVYVWIYTAWFKRTSVWSTVVGAISGAVPPVIGYCAISAQIDAGAWILFAILFLWQMPHFWALGIRRVEEYRAAGFPLLPVVRGSYVTKISMMRYVVLLVPTSALLYLYGYVGMIYLVSAVVMGIYWVYLCLKGFSAKDEEAWAKKTFIFSINYLTLLFIIIVMDTVHVS
ncbi:MAG: heme o synthase [Paenibacillaceae bacterium]